MKDIADKISGDKYLTTDFNDGVNRELRKFVIDSGAGFNDSNNAQLIESVVLINSARASYIEDLSSTGAIYVATIANTGKQGLISLEVGATISLKITHTNTVTNPTLQLINPTLATHTIKHLDGAALEVGELTTGMVIDLYFDGTDWLVKNFNDDTNLRDIEEGQLYTVTGISGNEYTLTISAGVSPTSYYSGMIVRFISTQTNTANVTLKITGLAPIPLRDSQNVEMQHGDIGNGDLIEAMYTSVNNTFRVLKNTTSVIAQNNGVIIARSNDITKYLSFLNTVPYNFIASGVVNITVSSDKQFFYFGDSNITINLPDIGVIPKNFSFNFGQQTSTDRILTFNAVSGQVIDMGDIGATAQTRSLTIAHKSGTFGTIQSDDGGVWILRCIKKAEEDIAGVAQIATQAQVDAGIQDDMIVTPYKLKHTPFIANLEVVFPVGAYFDCENPLMVSDPDAIVPGWGTFTWTPLIGMPVQRCNRMSTSPLSLVVTGLQGSQDPLLGTVFATTLTAAQMPAHAHRSGYQQAVNLYDVIPNPGPVLQMAISKDDDLSDNCFGFWPDTIPGPTAPNPNIMAGGGQPHSHGLNLISYITYTYKRTA